MKIKLSALLLLAIFTTIKPSEDTSSSNDVCKVIFYAASTDKVVGKLEDVEQKELTTIFEVFNSIPKKQGIVCNLYNGWLTVLYKKEKMSVKQFNLEMTKLLNDKNSKNIKYRCFTSLYA